MSDARTTTTVVTAGAVAAPRMATARVATAELERQRRRPDWGNLLVHLALPSTKDIHFCPFLI